MTSIVVRGFIIFLGLFIVLYFSILGSLDAVLSLSFGLSLFHFFYFGFLFNDFHCFQVFYNSFFRSFHCYIFSVWEPWCCFGFSFGVSCFIFYFGFLSYDFSFVFRCFIILFRSFHFFSVWGAFGAVLGSLSV